ncbi:hypothetical protein ASPWEDRAFT_85559, partial [Aspergillus wentii DTO 134E9]
MTCYWADAEVVVAIYFLSRGFSEAAVAELLSHRGFWRSARAVHHKVLDILTKFPYLQKSPRFWDIEAVDQWLDCQSLDHKTVNNLIYCLNDDAKVAEQVRMFLLYNV